MLDQDIQLSTRKIYSSRWRIFKLYCGDLEVDPTSCSTEVVINFLTILRRNMGLRYQTVCGYRSAISKYHVGTASSTLGSERMVRRLTRACFLEDPLIPRYSDIWDVDRL